MSLRKKVGDLSMEHGTKHQLAEYLGWEPLECNGALVRYCRSGSDSFDNSLLLRLLVTISEG